MGDNRVLSFLCLCLCAHFPFQLLWGELFSLMQTSYRVLPHNRSKATRPRAMATLASQRKPFSLRNRLSQLVCHRYRKLKRQALVSGLSFARGRAPEIASRCAGISSTRTWMRLTPLGYPHKVDLTVNVSLCVSSGRKHGNKTTV